MKKYIKVGLLILWMGVIFYLSSQNGVQSDNLSRGLLSSIGQLLNVSNIDKFTSDFNLLIRKFAHFTEYFILGILMLVVLKEYNIKKKEIITTIILCAIYAISDEIHQISSTGRVFSVIDISIDTLGASFGSFLTTLVYKHAAKRKSS